MGRNRQICRADDRSAPLNIGVPGLTKWLGVRNGEHDHNSRNMNGLAFSVRVLRADLGNFFPLQYRACDGFLITAKNSGTHWLKYMLSCAIAAQYGVPAPTRSSGREADSIIGHPRWPAVHDHLPRIGSSHSIPSGAFGWRIAPLRPAPVVVLVRDIREAMLSNYVKWRDRYAVDLPTYARGDPSGRRFVADIWWYIHFFNRWGDVAQAWPERVMIVHYEAVQSAPAAALRRIASHYGIALGAEALAAGVAVADRASVQAQLDPDYGETIIPETAARAQLSFSPAEETFIAATLHRHLRHGLEDVAEAKPAAAPSTKALAAGLVP